MTDRVVHLTTVHQARDNRIHNKECQALLDAGFDVILVAHAVEDEPAGRPPLVALTAHRGRFARVVSGQWQSWQVLQRLRPRLVHIHDPELVPMTWLWARLHRAKAIFDAHEDLVAQVSTKPYLPELVRPLVRLLARGLVVAANHGMDAVIAATDDVAGGFAHPRTVVVRNYPWLKDYPPVEARPVPGRVAYVGDLTEERRLSFMIEVVRRARQSRPEVHLVLAGRPLGSAQSVLDRISEPGLVDHRGLLRPAEVPGVLASASVGLIFLDPLPNYTRSLPTKLFEYMAAGVPFLASDFPFWRQEFEPWDAGRFTDSTDVDVAAAALVEMLDDAEARARMGRNGRLAIEQGLNFESQAPALVELARDLLA